MKEPIRILQITGGMDMGGIENFIMNIYRNIDRKKVQFDFLIHQEKKQVFEDEILSLGGKIYRIPSIRKSGYFKYKKDLKDFFNNNFYKVVHSHYNELSGIILKVAKQCGIKTRISHSHTSYPYSKIILKLISEYFIRMLKDEEVIKFACSKKAGEWLYGVNSDFKVINNGINPKEYKFNQDLREKVRSELNIKRKEILIGHVGRFSREKNHSFLIKIFNELLRKNKNYVLALVGTGDTLDTMKKEVEELNIGKNVRFLGVRKDVNRLLQAFDLFILPSIFEGLPVTLVEAQGAGLKCFISDSITREIDLECGLTEFISLNKSPKEWAEIINRNKKYERKDTVEALRSHGYDMTKNAKELENLYIELYENN